MDIGQEVLSTLGQAQYSFKIDNLRAGLRGVAEAARQQLQVVQFLLYLLRGISLYAHSRRNLHVNISISSQLLQR